MSIQYKTENKEAVYDFFKKNKDRHFTAEKVSELLEADGIHVPKSTLYRIISSMSSAGMLKRFETKGEDKFVFQFSNFGKECNLHFHLKCTECGKLIHMECEKMNELKEHIKNEHGFIIGGEGIIYGICEKCVK